MVESCATCRSHDAAIGGDIECNYKIGKDLHIAIAGVGEATAGVTFFRSNWDGDFYGSFGVQHGCIVVQAGKAAPAGLILGDIAFISPKNGKVYRTWQSCQRTE